MHRLCFERLEPRTLLSGTGLVGQYFHNSDLTGLAFERNEAVDFPWGIASPAPGVAPDSFSVRWIGQVEPTYSENYTFRTISDDGVRLWVDGKLLIDNWNVHTARVDSGTITLQAGEKHDIRLEYFEDVGTSQIRLQWTSASQPLETIPVQQLYAPLEGLRGEYSPASGGSAERTDATVDFAWADGPIEGVAGDGFQTRWAGFVRADYSEEYVFRTVSDEGIRVWVGDKLIVDNWIPHAAAVDVGSISLEAGKWYDIRIEYFDETGPAEARLLWSSERQTGVGQFAVLPASNLRAAHEAPLYVSNPLGPGADPFVVHWQDSYLLVRSTGNSVYIDKADQLQDVHRDDPASVTVRAWTPPPGMPYSTMVWAPELHQFDGKWYIYVAAAANDDNSTHRMYVLERDSPDPMGSYVFKGQIASTTNRWAIDGTVLSWNDKLYFVWSGWAGFSDGQQNLYIAEMSNPWTISGDRVLLATPNYGWERHGLPINEGPEALVHDGKMHIVFSASAYWEDEYALGRLTFNGIGPILSGTSWTKAAQPVFQQAGSIVGVGHASFTQSPDGTESWIVYHAHHDANNWQNDRDILIQPFSYNADRTPNFGSPIPVATPIEVPSGTPDPNRVPAPADADANGAINGFDLDVLVGQFGEILFPGTSADATTDGVVDGADILAWQRRQGTPLATAAASHSSSAVIVEVTSTELALNRWVAASLHPQSDRVAQRSGRAVSRELRFLSGTPRPGNPGEFARPLFEGQHEVSLDKAFAAWAAEASDDAPFVSNRRSNFNSPNRVGATAGSGKSAFKGFE